MSGKDAALKDFEKIIEHMEAHAESYTEEDWEEADQKIEDISNRLSEYQDQMTVQDLKTVMRLSKDYAKLRFKSAASSAIDYLDELFSE